MPNQARAASAAGRETVCETGDDVAAREEVVVGSKRRRGCGVAATLTGEQVNNI